MNLIQPGGSNRSAGSRQDLADLHEALKAAATVLGLSDAVRVTGAALLNRIPRDAPSPTSPASVAGLAAERGCGERTIRNHIQTLIRSGLAQNRCLDGGRRHCHRDQGGDIVAIYGIDFTLLADRAPDLATDLEQIRQDRIEATRLRHEISRLRRTIRHIITLHPVTVDQYREWTAFPRRLAHLGKDALEMWISRVKALHATLIEGHPDDRGRQDESDRPEKIDRQYMTYQNISETCNPAMAAQTTQEAGQGTAQPTCGLEHVTLQMALDLAPADWRIAMERHGHATWHGLVATAYERGGTIGLHPGTWAQAEAALGRPGAALLVLLADAQCAERGGPIRSPGGWIRRMSERAEAGAAHLHRSVFGLLHRAEAA